jgi:hypothetical protein
MKKAQKVTRIQLEVSRNEKLFLYGIVSTEPDYKLSLALNKKMGISLKNKAPLNLPDDLGNEVSFSRFVYTNRSEDAVYNLISNRSGKQFLIKKLKNIDYIFHIHRHGSENDSSKIISQLRETESVNAVFLLDTGLINNKNLKYIIQ